MYRQIADCIQKAIDQDLLKANDRLPTNRELALLLSVDRSTAARAYLELQQAGVIESCVGRGTQVCAREKNLPLSREEQADIIWSDKFSNASNSLLSIMNRRRKPNRLNENLISFSPGVPSDRFYPYEQYAEIIAQLQGQGRLNELFNYAPQRGHRGLLEEIKKQLEQSGISALDDELIVVSGSQQGIDLVAATLVNPGDLVLIEDPTYVLALSAFKKAQAHLIPIPVDQEGLRVDLIESVVQRQNVKLIYLMPNFQNPTGTTLSLFRRKKLIEIARRYKLPVFEDNYVGDLYYDGKPLPSLRALDRSVVIHQSTFSKVLSPGLRLGYLLAPPALMSRLGDAKWSCDLSTNTSAQVIICEFLKQGLYDKHLQYLRSEYKKRRDVMLSSLSREFAGQISFRKPDGGMFVWARLPEGYSAQEFLAYAERKGASFMPGDMYFLEGERREFFRLSFVQLDPPAIEEGVRRLGLALKDYLRDSKVSAQAVRQNFWTNESLLI